MTISTPPDRPSRGLLVTGASGFIGQNFCAKARQHGHHVVRLVRSQPAHDADTVLYDPDPRILAERLAAHSCDTIVHCAASYSPADAPEETNNLVEANMSFALNVLQAGQLAGLERLVNLGSLWEHGPDGQELPVNLYAQLKLAFQGCLDYFARAHGLSAITLKLADTYGEHDTRGKLMSLLRDTARTGQTLRMTSGFQIINPVHVDDVCDAMLKAVAHLEGVDGHTRYVVDGDTPGTVRDLVAIAQSIWTPPLNVVFGAVEIDGYKPAEIWTTGPRLESWAPKISLHEGLKRMAP